MKIVVGSKSKHKIAAVVEALDLCHIDASVEGVAAPSGIPEQPSGVEQTRMGASNRASNAQKAEPVADMWIGIESGLVSAYGSFYDTAFVVLLLPNGLGYSAMCGGHSVPKAYVDEAHRKGFGAFTVGSVMAEQTGCDATDGTSHITGGVVSRTDTLVQGLAIALASWKRASGA